MNAIDSSITLGCLNAEQSLKTAQASHPWSPTLATAILFVQLWNCVKTKLKTNSINTSRIISIETRILSYNISQTIPNTKTKVMKQINNHLRKAHKHLKDTRLKAHALRHKHLLQCQKDSEISENKTHTQFLKTLIVIEKQRDDHRFIRSYSKQSDKSGIKYIDIPKDYSIDWNKIPKKTPPEYWERVTIPAEIEKYIIKRNKRHLHQAQGTPCTVDPLASLLGYNSFTQFGQQVLDGSVNLTNKNLSPLQQLFFKQLKKQSGILTSPISKHISIKQMSDGFKCWRESTSTSPSKRHLGHYKSLLTSDGNEKNQIITHFNASMLQLLNTIINASISIGVPLTRWTTSEVIMIEKEKNNPRINRLRVINKYEADYNLILKISGHIKPRTMLNGKTC